MCAFMETDLSSFEIGLHAKFKKNVSIIRNDVLMVRNKKHRFRIWKHKKNLM